MKVIFDWDDDWIENHKEEIDPYWGISFRQSAQWLGTDAIQYDLPSKFELFKNLIGRNLWVKKIEKKYLKDVNQFMAISDYRFPHEYETLKKYHPICIRVNRNVPHIDTHESECMINNLHTDFEIDNNSTLESLYKNIDNVMGLALQGRKEI